MSKSRANWNTSGVPIFGINCMNSNYKFTINFIFHFKEKVSSNKILKNFGRCLTGSKNTYH